MDSLEWETASQEFVFTGGFRDIYVFDVDLQAWQDMLDALRRAKYEMAYHRNGEQVDLPLAAADAFPEEGMADRLLAVRFANVQAHCHFFTQDEIEFDIDPREVLGQPQLDGVIAFMRLLAAATGKDAVMTPEGFETVAVFRVRPHQRAIEYHPFGSW